MSLVISKGFNGVTKRFVLARTYVGIDDPDATAYITAVEAADTAAGQSGGLETATKIAIHSFVKGCKVDGTWSAIKASCILAGARTLAGALVPLAGTAPTNVGPFTSGDYNRKTGLVGNGTSKYLNSNRLLTADPQNSIHLSVWISTVTTSGAGSYPIYIGGSAAGGVPATHIGRLENNGGLFSRNRSTGFAPYAGSGTNTGLLGMARSNSADYTFRTGGSSTNSPQTSSASENTNVGVFGLLTNNVPDSYANARLAFYSIGESLNLALLDTRVTALITAFGVAIP
jgi:hypothetical protein